MVRFPEGFAADLAGLAFAAALGAVGAGAPFRRAAQRAFMEAASLARPSGVSPPFFLGAAAGFAAAAGAGEVPFTLAQRARAAEAIFSRASGESGPRRPLAAGFWDAFAAGAGEAPPKIAASWDWSFSICSEISRACFSCWMDGLFVGMG